jgi:hypothetical protein
MVVSPANDLVYVTFNPQQTSSADRTSAGVDVIRLPAPLGVAGR